MSAGLFGTNVAPPQLLQGFLDNRLALGEELKNWTPEKVEVELARHRKLRTGSAAE